MRNFKITKENVLDVLEVLVNLEDRITNIRQLPTDTKYLEYEVTFLYRLPKDFISPSPGVNNHITFSGKGDSLVEAVQDIIDQMQDFFETSPRRDDLHDYQVDFEVNIASALGLLRPARRKIIRSTKPDAEV